MDKEAWHATVDGVAKSWTWLRDWTTNFPKIEVGGGWFLLLFGCFVLFGLVYFGGQQRGSLLFDVGCHCLCTTRRNKICITTSGILTMCQKLVFSNLFNIPNPGKWDLDKVNISVPQSKEVAESGFKLKTSGPQSAQTQSTMDHITLCININHMLQVGWH